MPLLAIGLLAACASPERTAQTPTGSSYPMLTGALGAPIAPAATAPLSGSTTAPPAVAVPGAPVRMSENELLTAFSGNTAAGVTTNGQPYALYFDRNGQERFRQGSFEDAGVWRVLPDGRFCSSLARVSSNSQECYFMYQSGNNVTFQRPDGVTVGSVTVIPGNPQRL